MKSTDRLALAMLAAEKFVRDRGISELPVNLSDIARDLNIQVFSKPSSSPGVSGMLLRSGDSYGIAYATHIDSVGFQRFCIGHELGHYLLPGHLDAVLGAGDVHESRAGFASGDPYELEADHFAAGLLMPKHLFVPAMRGSARGLKAIENLSVLCETSLTATAIRFAQCSPDPIAIILSTGATIDYCFMSDELKELDGIDWIRKRQVVPKGTPTFEFNRNSENARTAHREFGESTLQQWFGGRHNIDVEEDVVGLGSYGKTLTVLHGFTVPDEEEEEDEDAIVDSWTPRFKK